MGPGTRVTLSVRPVVETERQTAGRPAALQERVQWRREHGEAAIIELGAECIGTARQYDTMVEAYGVCGELFGVGPVERDTLRRSRAPLDQVERRFRESIRVIDDVA